MDHWVSAAHVQPGQPPVVFGRCPFCGSLNAMLDSFIDFDNVEVAHQDASWVRHYLQVGAGIDSMIRPLQRIRSERSRTLLDVGCGIGFAVNFWNWAGGEADGVEPSPYGYLGRQWLEGRVVPAYLADVPQLAQRTFDVVFSSEVVEHVDDAPAFLAELRRVTGATGVLTLTTPDADYIQPHHEVPGVLAGLSPGLHRVLFSARALEALLRQVGFTQVEVVASDGRLVARAASQLPILGESPEQEQAEYLRYLLYTADQVDHADLKAGLLFRAFKEQVNLGQQDAAEKTFHQLVKLVHYQYGLWLTDLATIADRAWGVVSFDEFGQRLPYFTPVCLFYAAMVSLNGTPLLNDARAAFQLSAQLALQGRQLAPLWFREAESLIGLAFLHRAIAALRKGEHQQAKADLTFLLQDIPDELSFEVLIRARREWAVLLLQTGDAEQAMVVLSQLMVEAPRLRADLRNLYRVARQQVRHSRPTWWQRLLRGWFQAS